MGDVIQFPVIPRPEPKEISDAERERRIAAAKLLADVVAKWRAPWEKWSCGDE